MRKFLITLLLASTTAHADSLLDQGMSLIDQGRALLRGDDGIVLRKAWNTGDSQAYVIIRDRATHGNDIAQNLMGVIFDTGRFGQNRDPGKALAWFNQAGVNNNFVAFYNLGIIYSTGRTPGSKQDTAKAAKAFEMVYATKRGKAIPQVIIWLATYYYNTHDYQKAWALCAELTTQKWIGYTNYLKARMLLEGTAPEGRNSQQAIRLLEESLNRQTPNAAPLLLWAYQTTNNQLMTLVTQMIMERSIDIQMPTNMSQSDYDQARNIANLWIKNHGLVPEVLDFTSTITGFEAWVP